jgi:hypothetical protein
MKAHRRALRQWGIVVIFAIGMAWVEAACVYYLRVLVDRVEPYQANPLPMRGGLNQVELVREAATLVMLLTVGLLAGRTRRTRLAHSAIAFGVWDIGYYVFLRLMCGWPTSLFDWDILFLLPLPWWGPVIAPVLIALLMIAWGTLVTQRAASLPATSLTSALWSLNVLGVALALYIFMADSLRALPQGPDAMRAVLPRAFNWPGFSVALALMTAPVAHAAWRNATASRSSGRSQLPVAR